VKIPPAAGDGSGLGSPPSIYHTPLLELNEGVHKIKSQNFCMIFQLFYFSQF